MINSRVQPCHKDLEAMHLPFCDKWDHCEQVKTEEKSIYIGLQNIYVLCSLCARSSAFRATL